MKRTLFALAVFFSSAFALHAAGIEYRIPGGVGPAGTAGSNATAFNSTMTVLAEMAGDIFIATGTGNSPWIFITGEDTYTITSVQPFIKFPSTSTMHTNFSLGVSTEQADSNFRYKPIHSSSFIVPGYNVYGNQISSLNVTSELYPHQKMALFVNATAISSGTTASEGGVKIKMFRWP